MHEQTDQVHKRIRNNANHISSSIMVLQTNTMTLGKLMIKLITNFPNVMVLLIIGEYLLISASLHVTM